MVGRVLAFWFDTDYRWPSRTDRNGLKPSREGPEMRPRGLTRWRCLARPQNSRPQKQRDFQSPRPTKTTRRCGAPNGCATRAKCASTTCCGIRSSVHRVVYSMCLRPHTWSKWERAPPPLRARRVGAARVVSSALILNLIWLRRLLQPRTGVSKPLAPHRTRMSCSNRSRTKRTSPAWSTTTCRNRRSAEVKVAARVTVPVAPHTGTPPFHARSLEALVTTTVSPVLLLREVEQSESFCRFPSMP